MNTDWSSGSVVMLLSSVVSPSALVTNSVGTLFSLGPTGKSGSSNVGASAGMLRVRVSAVGGAMISSSMSHVTVKARNCVPRGA